MEGQWSNSSAGPPPERTSASSLGSLSKLWLEALRLCT